jgi:hypothetical protein
VRDIGSLAFKRVIQVSTGTLADSYMGLTSALPK